MTIQSRLEEWLQTKGEDISLEHAEEIADKAQDFCYTCARADELKRVILTAAYTHFKLRLERGDIMGKIVLVTSDNCSPCDEVVSALRPLIEQGEIEVVDYAHCEDCDKEAIQKAGISTFPSMAIRSKDGLVVSPISLAPEEEKVEERSVRATAVREEFEVGAKIREPEVAVEEPERAEEAAVEEEVEEEGDEE